MASMGGCGLLLTKAFVHILATASLAVRVSTFVARLGLTLLKASFNSPSNELFLRRALFSSHLYVPCTVSLGSNREYLKGEEQKSSIKSKTC